MSADVSSESAGSLADSPLGVRTKIVATVGPACSSDERLYDLARAGVNVFRLNLAHGALMDHEAALAAIRRASHRLERPIGILADLAGPKIRLGALPNDCVDLTRGQTVRFVRDAAASGVDAFVSTYPALVDELHEGDRILLADGTVGMQVIERQPDAIVCRVTNPGRIRSRQGINLPGAKLSVEALTPVDRQHAAWAARMEIDFVSLSFVRHATDIELLKQLLSKPGSRAKVIAKIEKPEALAELEAIVSVADGIMIARGDLGVEIDVARVPVVQKQIIRLCNRMQKPVITATQMLDSMQREPRPTRAEASDVANAILDGTDACMLSGETAIGQYPIESVEMMRRIARETESLLRDRKPRNPGEVRSPGVHPITQATVDAAGLVASLVGAKMIVVATHSGATALAVSKRRNWAPTIGTGDNPAVHRQMCLYWGVVPLEGAPTGQPNELVEFVCNYGMKHMQLGSGDRLVVVAGTGLGLVAHNQMLVHEIP